MLLQTTSPALCFNTREMQVPQNGPDFDINVFVDAASVSNTYLLAFYGQYVGSLLLLRSRHALGIYTHTFRIDDRFVRLHIALHKWLSDRGLVGARLGCLSRCASLLCSPIRTQLFEYLGPSLLHVLATRWHSWSSTTCSVASSRRFCRI